MTKHHVAIELIGRAGRLLRELDRSSSGIRKFGGAVKGEFRALRDAGGSLQGKLAGLGISLGAGKITKDSALLDKKLIQIGQTADVDRMKVAELRKEISGMAKKSGQDIDALADGFNAMIQAGQSWASAMESTRGVNMASAITGARGDVLAKALSVAANNFKIDLEKPGQALEMLDKMLVGGRKGNAELENMAALFPRVANNANKAGMSFEATIAFIETLSKAQADPGLLGTLADSTLRIFTNLNYLKAAQKATRVSFYDENRNRRDPLDVLKDMREQYRKLTSDAARDVFLFKAFGAADQDTIKGLGKLFEEGSLDEWGEILSAVKQASGTINRDFSAATDNLIDQAGRLKETLREAADAFTKPMRDTLAEWIKYGLDQKKLTGGQIMAGGAGLAIGGAALARYGPKAIGALARKFGTDAGGITAGLAVEAATGVQPVFVTNWPGAFGGGLPGKGASLAKNGKGALAAAGKAGQFGAAMYGINELVAEPMGIGWSSMVKSYQDFATAYGRLLDYASGRRDWRTDQPIEVNNQITIDGNRVISETDGMNTTVNTELRRGRMDR